MRDFLADSGFDAELIDRISYLIAHHHTMTGIDGMDYQILIEADFLVNAAERAWERSVAHFLENVAKTDCGRRLLQSIFLDK